MSVLPLNIVAVVIDILADAKITINMQLLSESVSPEMADYIIDLNIAIRPVVMKTTFKKITRLRSLHIFRP